MSNLHLGPFFHFDTQAKIQAKIRAKKSIELFPSSTIYTGIFDPNNIAIHVAQNAVRIWSTILGRSINAHLLVGIVFESFFCVSIIIIHAECTRICRVSSHQSTFLIGANQNIITDAGGPGRAHATPSRALNPFQCGI